MASADGVGTKLVVAKLAGDYSSVGRDLVNHCVNDILVQGAEPLFFMDYLGAGVLEPEKMVELVSGVADGCRENGCALLGGETAEMPGFYQPGDYELVGFIVGLVDRPKVLDGSRVKAGDVLVGLPSSGLHTNGYSLARKVVFEKAGLKIGDKAPWNKKRTVGEELLEAHVSYLEAVRPLLGHAALHGMAHVTGGGITDNLPRVLPPDTHALIRVGSWTIPEPLPLPPGDGRGGDGGDVPRLQHGDRHDPGRRSRRLGRGPGPPALHGPEELGARHRPEWRLGRGLRPRARDAAASHG